MEKGAAASEDRLSRTDSNAQSHMATDHVPRTVCYLENELC